MATLCSKKNSDVESLINHLSNLTVNGNSNATRNGEDKPKSMETKVLNLENQSEAYSNLINTDSIKYFPKLIELNVASCEVTEVPRDIFKLKYLTSLNLANNRLENVPEEISELANLLCLNLSNNLLTDLPKSLKQASQLKHLNISKNELLQVPEVLYEGLRLLRVLNMSYNLIEEFNDAPECFNKLMELNLRCNQLIELPHWMSWTDCCLEMVDLSGNNFKNGAAILLANTCNKGFFETVKTLYIESSNFNYNKLGFIMYLKKIETVHLSNTEDFPCRNFLQEVKMSIFKEANDLKFLYMNGVNISLLPDDLGYLKRVQILDLSNNVLSWIPDCFGELESLVECYLTSNTLTFLPQTFEKLTNLKKLYLDNNHFYEVSESLFNLKNLEYLDLYNNKIENINPDLILKMNLKGIDLELNCINFEKSLNEEKLNLWKAHYENLKQNIRLIIDDKETRGNFQKQPSVEEPESEDSFSSFWDRESSSDEDYNEEHNKNRAASDDEFWDDFSTEKNTITEDDVFDPNITEGLKAQWMMEKEREKEIYKNNFCPADRHAKSLADMFANSREATRRTDILVEGQFDSD